MRKAHYWRKAGPRSAPSEIIVLDCETWHADRAKCPGGEFHTLRLGCALSYRLEKGKRTRIRKLVFRKAAEFWTFVKSRLSKQRPVWVFGHNIAYDLGAASGWQFILGGTYTVEKAAVSGQIFYLKGRVKKDGLIFCDTINYFRCSLAALGKAVGFDKLPMPKQEASDAEWETYCWRDVEVTAAGVDHLIAFIRKEMLGPWQPSIASLSFAAFRSCFLKDKVLVHPYKSILELERGCYYGGIVDTPRIGRVSNGTVHELDVVSMYPSVCRRPLPIKLKHWSRGMGVRGIRDLSDRFQVAAEVDLDTPDTTYPIRLKGGTYFPTGRFRTCLAHPELMQAIDRGFVKNVHCVAWYESAPIFKDYMEFFTSLKGKYRTDGNEAFSTLCKYYANSLYGKTGQLSPHWREWGEEALQALEDKHRLKRGALEEWYESPPDMYEIEETIRIPPIPVILEIRHLYGVVEIKVGEGESRESCPIIAATVTSYARLLLRHFQTVAGSGEWFYSDTDSIWVSDRGRGNLEAKGYVRTGELGYLEYKSTHEWLEVFGPKDYQTPTLRRMKGVRFSAEPTDDGGWRQLHFPSALTQIRDQRNDGVFVRETVKHLKRTMKKCIDLGEGVTRPLIFPGENPDSGQRRK